MVSKLAGPETVRHAGLQVGSNGLARGYVNVGEELDADGRWAARLPAFVSRRDDVQDFVGAERQSAARQFAAPSLTWSPGNDTRLSLFALNQRDEYDRTLGLPLDGTLRPSPVGEVPQSRFLGEPSLPRIESEQWQLGYLLSHRFTPAVALRSKLRYSDFQLSGPIVQAPRPSSTATEIARRIDQTNIVNADLAIPGFSVSVGEQRHDGFELEISGRPSDVLTLRAGYTYLDAVILAINNADVGQRPVDVPRHAASAFATLAGAAFGIDRADISLGARHVSERCANDSGDVLPSYTVLDAAARYRLGTVSIGLHVKNMFDKRHYVAGGVRSVIDGQPRVVQITLGLDF